jgi:hypothetical protein
MTLPSYEFLSAPLGLIRVLHELTLTLHFAAMNVLLGGLVIVLYARLRRRWADPVLVRFVRLFPSLMAATVTLGVAPLLFLQLVYHRQVYAAAIVSGWFWLAIVGAVIVAYYAIYRASFAGARAGAVGVAPLLLALTGLLYVSLTYSSIFTMAERPELLHALYARDPSGLVWNPALGDYLLRWAHMVFGALTVGGFFVGLIGRDEPAAHRAGTQCLVGGMAGAMVLGMAYVLSLMPVLPALMATPAIWALAGAIVLSLGALHFYFEGNFLASGLMLFVSMFGMVHARHTVRVLRLAATFDPSTLRIAPQWGPFAMFLISFVAALAVLAYMLRLFFVGHAVRAR